MKRILAGLLTIAMILGLTACGGKSGDNNTSYPTPEAPVTIKWGLSVSPSNQAYINAQIVADHVMEATGGAVKVELYPNSQLGNEAAMWEGILSGTIDMANISTGTLSSTIPDFEAFTLPFVFGNAETFWNVMAQEEFREKFSERAAEKNVVFVGISSMFTRGIATKAPVTLPSDLSGKKLRIMSGHTYSDMFSSWGAGTVIMGFNEVYTALQQDVVDGLCVDVGGAVDQKFFEQAPYFVDTFHSFHCSPGVMRSNLWNSLSPEQQQAFVDGYKLVAEKGVDTYYDELEASTRQAEDMGVTFTYLTPEQKQEWIDAVSWMYEDYEYIDSDFLSWFISFIDANKVESRG
ncbi:MAG: TRAP transporter substrate-binding protein [Butyricicoccus sp.]|nr:TRAP transporter substrate-binding protein [Butyricicoccus sp.]